MSIKFKITWIETVKGTHYIYLDVAFLKGGQVMHRNDFIMQIQPVYRIYIGRVGPNGEQLDQGDEYFEQHDTDVRAAILDNIRRYVARADLAVKDNRDRGIRTEDTDPLGLRARPGVAELIGAEVDV